MNLFSLAGNNSNSGLTAGSNILGSLGGAALPLAFMGGPWGMGLAAALGGASVLGPAIMKPFIADSKAAAGKKMYNEAQSNLNATMSKHPGLYSTDKISDTFNSARHSLISNNEAQTNALADRYSSIQRRNMANRIKSGLSSGAAQASAIQNQMGFQKQANNLFQQQSQNLSNLRLRERSS